MRRNTRAFLFIFALLMVLTPAFPVLAAAQEILKVGSQGGRVTELQIALRNAGFFPASQKATGYYGWITYGAVTALEKKHGLKVDGQVGDQEWQVLYSGKASSKVVLGYYTVDYPGDKLSYNALANANRMINQVAMFDYGIDARGNLKGGISPEGLKLARNKGAGTLMVVHNISSGTFDRQSCISVITNSESRSRLINNIVGQLDKGGYNGVNIDFEGLPAYCRDEYNAFLEQLGGKLKAKGKLLTVAIPAKTSDSGNSWSAAYDYKTIGRLADYVVIMAYDEHWSGGPAGPVASAPWVEQVIKYAGGVVPAQKILLGLGSYGYDWPAWQKGKTVKWKDVPKLVSQSGGVVQWSNTYSVPYLNYTKSGVKHQVWFENKYSLGIKLNLAKKYGLGGVAMWRLGYEDASFWETVEKHFWD